ncbi:MAG: LPS assembly lipoprotein LptE [Saprospiraceae bacterium]|nr:LPS assembly lipoprotein LptE [Saprospiraceae bacterium]MDZ4703505.1 LPS assembly lipoprotein LptE [Saprospiraceae bacterium]
MTMRTHPLIFLSLLSVTFWHGCYSFRGIDIDAETRTYYVEQLKNNALDAAPSLPQTFTEALKEKIRTESRLVLDDKNPDIEFRGAIVDFRVSAESPQPGERTALNRLTIVTAIEFINHKNEAKNWKQNFTFFYNFPSVTSLTSVQEEAIQAIGDQIMEDIFNKAFTNW